MRCTNRSSVHKKTVESTVLSLRNKSIEEFPSTSNLKDYICMSNLHDPETLPGTHWLEKIVQAFISCVTTGNVKVLYIQS